MMEIKPGSQIVNGFHRSGNCAIHFFRTREKPFFGVVTIIGIFADGVSRR
jgi:hypothetical protein